MKTSSKVIIAVIAAAVLVVGYAFSTYNKLVTTNERISTEWAQVETQYQRRFDLIPNLVSTVQGVMKQETAIFTALAEARTKYAGAQTVDEKVRATSELESTVSRLLVIVENYPTLKSADAVRDFISQQEGTENRIATARRDYNASVNFYNVMVKRVPSSIIAGMFGFDAHEYFEAASGAENAPTVNL